LNRDNRSALGKLTIRGAIAAMTKPLGQAACNELIAQYRRGAEVRSFSWSLTNEQAIALFTQDCFYCGRPPAQRTGKKANNGCFIYNGIDRVDPKRGYTSDNVVPCCRHCNWVKGASTLDEFYANIALIARHHPEILTSQLQEIA
jgi:hypothetical protein